ncbi:zinc D-Ala-D-Ala carboxypeptidase [Enterococcus sp. AZ194]|uniref:M15 family metallopeptidase n=1 Tax=Enterococcus sp. AZ194 TaxID=2774629 RepID=UPI003F23B81B
MNENKQLAAAISFLVVSLVIFFSVTNLNTQGKTTDSTATMHQSTTNTDTAAKTKTTPSTSEKKVASKTSSSNSVKKASTATSTKETQATTEASTKKATSKKATSETSTTETTDKKADLPKASKTDWNLVLVGPKNKLPSEIKDSQLVSLSNGFEVDKRIAKEFAALEDAAKKAGYPLVTISAFRSVAYQEEVFAEGVTQNMSKLGISEEEAKKEAKKTMTEPGYSEHHTGLALDVVDEQWNKNYVGGVLDERFGDQPGAKWLAENASKFGFIIRYPKNQEKITSITYEPWHIRYVGKENAEYISKNQLTLEEYLGLLK